MGPDCLSLHKQQNCQHQQDRTYQQHMKSSCVVCSSYVPVLLGCMKCARAHPNQPAVAPSLRTFRLWPRLLPSLLLLLTV